MIELKPHLKELISLPGLSSFEAPVRQYLTEQWEELTDELQTSKLGSLHGVHRGIAEEPRPSVLFATHMDAVGLMVTDVVDGFLRVTEIGGLDPRVLPGQLVTVHGREDLPGVIVQTPENLIPKDAQGKPLPLTYLLIDVALSADEVENLVRVGDPISFAQAPMDLGDTYVAGHSLDNRASVAALTYCLEILKTRKTEWDIWAVATVQEEETFAGALTSAFQLKPTIAVAIDVTFASSPGSPEHLAFPLGEGVTLGWGPNIHPAVHKLLKDVANKVEIPYKLEAMPRHSGTDAYALQTTAAGIPTMVLSIPLRYMHTPVEVVSIKDVKRAGRLLAEFASSLDENTLDELKWEKSDLNENRTERK